MGRMDVPLTCQDIEMLVFSRYAPEDQGQIGRGSVSPPCPILHLPLYPLSSMYVKEEDD